MSLLAIVGIGIGFLALWGVLPLERWLPRIAVALGLAGFVVRVSLGAPATAPVFLYVYAALMVATLVVCEVAGRLLLRRGQPAGSALELAWDDALRSRALNAIAVTPFFLGAYFGLVAPAFYPPTHDAGSALGSLIQATLVLVAAALLLVWSGTAFATKPQQRYLRRLWPEFASTAVAPVKAARS
jgi:hypothetical protein